jgi:hypothetical protein
MSRPTLISRSGAFGEVRLCTHKTTQQNRAVKVMKKKVVHHSHSFPTYSFVHLSDSSHLYISLACLFLLFRIAVFSHPHALALVSKLHAFRLVIVLVVLPLVVVSSAPHYNAKCALLSLTALGHRRSATALPGGANSLAPRPLCDFEAQGLLLNLN